MGSTAGHASAERLLEFCNRVRKVGKARRLKSLKRGIPGDSTMCLIAENLNFSCQVFNRLGEGWIMELGGDTAIQTGKLIADNLELKGTAHPGYNSCFIPAPDRYTIKLPRDIANTARDFDVLGELLEKAGRKSPLCRTFVPSKRDKANWKRLQDLLPFVSGPETRHKNKLLRVMGET